MGVVAVAGLLFLTWKRITIPDLGNAGERLFPDAAILDRLTFVCAAMLGLALADRFVQRVVDIGLAKPIRVTASLATARLRRRRQRLRKASSKPS